MGGPRGKYSSPTVALDDIIFVIMERKIKFSVDEYYHIYNRGTDKRVIFMDEEDHQRFTSLMFICNSERNVVFRDTPIGRPYVYERGDTLVDIGAYCLMPNHFHFLIREKIDGGVTKYMSKLLTAYVMYFNKKYKRTGSLFESKFKAKHADTDEYLKYLFAYIHLNPVKIIDPKWKEFGIQNRSEAKKYLVKYKYSSYLEYLGDLRMEGKILNRVAFPEYFADVQNFEGFIKDWMVFSETP